jgi:hypothetical protein
VNFAVKILARSKLSRSEGQLGLLMEELVRLAGLNFYQTFLQCGFLFFELFQMILKQVEID